MQVSLAEQGETQSPEKLEKFEHDSGTVLSSWYHQTEPALIQFLFDHGSNFLSCRQHVQKVE